MTDFDKLIQEIYNSKKNSSLISKFRKICRILIKNGKIKINRYLRCILEFKKIKKDPLFECELLNFMSKTTKVYPRSSGRVLPFIIIFLKKGLLIKSKKMLKTLLNCLPSIVESSLLFLCKESDIQMLPHSLQRKKILKEINLIQKVLLPISYIITISLIGINFSEIRMKSFLYARQCILLFTTIKTKRKNNFSHIKMKSKCKLLNTKILNKQSKKLINLLKKSIKGNVNKLLNTRDLCILLKIIFDLANSRKQFQNIIKDVLCDLKKNIILKKIIYRKKYEDSTHIERMIHAICNKIFNVSNFNDVLMTKKNFQNFGFKKRKVIQITNKKKYLSILKKKKNYFKRRSKQIETELVLKSKKINEVIFFLNEKTIFEIIVNGIKYWKFKKVSLLLKNAISSVLKSLRKKMIKIKDFKKTKKKFFDSLKSSILDKDNIIALKHIVFHRLLLTNVQNLINMEDKYVFYSSVIAKIYSKNIFYQNDLDLFINSLVEKFEIRMEITLYWLYDIYVKNKDRYLILTLKFIEKIFKRMFINKDDICFFFVMLPFINDQILKLCSTIKTNFYLICCCLRDVCMQRSSVKKNSLNILLHFSELDSIEKSKTAIAFIIEIFFSQPDLTFKIESFALNQLKRLTGNVPFFGYKPELEFYNMPIPIIETLEQAKVRKQKQECINRINELKVLKWECLERDKKNKYFRRNSSLFISLCTKKSSLLKKFIQILSNADRLTKTILSKMSIKMIKNLGMHSFNLNIAIATCPFSVEIWIKQICHVLLKQKGRIFNINFINALKELYKQTKNIKVLLPVIQFLKHKTIIFLLSKLISLDENNAKEVIGQLLLSKNKMIQPSELLIRIHKISPIISSPLLINVKILIQFCLGQSIFNDQKLAIVLQRLSQKRPIPVLFMRTLIQVLLIYPTLTKFSMKILFRIIQSHIWGSLDLWEGFVRCCKMCQPYSFSVLCALPRTQFKQILYNDMEMLKSLIKYVKNETILNYIKKTLLKNLIKRDHRNKYKDKNMNHVFQYELERNQKNQEQKNKTNQNIFQGTQIEISHIKIEKNNFYYHIKTKNYKKMISQKEFSYGIISVNNNKYKKNKETNFSFGKEFILNSLIFKKVWKNIFEKKLLKIIINLKR